MSKALIFDCDGVLAETEQRGHLAAFNQMWMELGIPWQWSVEEYGRKLKVGGGKERLASLFQEPGFLKAFQPPDTEEARQALVATWHKRKSTLYLEIILSESIPPRSGVKRLAEEALGNGWLVAAASTSAKESVDAVLQQAMGEDTARSFSVVLAGDVVKAKKPAPDIYNLAAKELGVAPRDCVAVEDSNNGVVAAVAAGMNCLVTVSDYTREEDFSKAQIVLSCLGDPGGEVCEVLANRSAARPKGYFTLEDLERVLTR